MSLQSPLLDTSALTRIDLIDVVEAHVHFRDLPKAPDVVPHTTVYAAYALAMPNVPPLRTGEETMNYNIGLKHIADDNNHDCDFIPCMMLTDEASPEEIVRAHAAGVLAVKVYPLKASGEAITTGAAHNGVTNLRNLEQTLAAMEELGLVLNLHGEKPDAFCLERETEFVNSTVPWLADTFPDLKIVIEHITKADTLKVINRYPNVYGSITVHHLMDDLDVLVGGNLNVHAFCKPVHKLPSDRRGLIDAVIDMNPKLFFGTDSAPHAVGAKECASGCAGAFTAPYALEMLATALYRRIFERHARGEDELGIADIKTIMQHFCSTVAMNFYRLAAKHKQVSLVPEKVSIPVRGFKFLDSVVIHYGAGNELLYSLVT